MVRRAPLDDGVRNRLRGSGLQRRRQLLEEKGDVIVERRGVEIPRRRQLPNLQTPPREQFIALAFDEIGQYIGFGAAHARSW
jgi:hypothetical protein